MAQRKILLVLGQSNATQVGDALSFEAAYPQLALRNPDVLPGQVPTFSGGLTPNRWTMPDTFFGAPRTDIRGDKTYGGGDTYQTFNIAGSAINQVRYLTFYNPAASYAAVGFGNTSDYPGTTKVAAPDTGDSQVQNGEKIIVEARTNATAWRADSSAASGSDITVGASFGAVVGDRVQLGTGFTGSVDTTTLYYVVDVTGGNIQISETSGGSAISGLGGSGSVYRVNFGTVTRRRTGTTHTAYMDVNNRSALHLVPPMRGPVPDQGEQVDYQVIAQAVPSSSTVIFNVQFGGNATTGSTGDASLGLGFAYYGTRGDMPGLVNMPGKEPQVGDALTVTLTANNTSLSSGTYYVASKRDPDVEGSGNIALTPTTSSDTITKTDHGLINKERVSPATTANGFTAAEVYEVNRIDDDSFKLHGPLDDTTTAVTATGATEQTFVRLDACNQFCITDEPGGAPLSWTESASPAQLASASFQAQYRGALSGLQLKGTAGNNDGDRVDLGSLELNADSNTVAEYSGSMTDAIAQGDVLQILPPQHNSADLPFDQWGYFLPWSPFEGRAAGNKTLSVSFGADGVVTPVVVAVALGMDKYDAVMIHWSEGDDETLLQEGDTVRFNGSPSSSDLLAGRYARNNFDDFGVLPGFRYTVHNIAAASGGSIISRPLGGTTAGKRYAFLKRAGSYLTGTTAGTGSTTGDIGMTVLRQEGKQNTAPPGFNFPQHYTSQWDYQAFDGDNRLSENPRASFHPVTAWLMSEYYNEPVYVVAHSIGNTSLATRSIPSSGQAARTSFGWYDPRQMLSWSEGSTPSMWSRLETVLDAAVIALEKAGDTGEVVGIVFAQGEADANVESETARYQSNLSKFVTKLRALIASKNLGSGDIPFVQPQIKVNNTNIAADIRARGERVNTAIANVVNDLAAANTFDTSDLTVMADDVHYDGVSMGTLGERVYDTWEAIVLGTDTAFPASADVSFIAEDGTGKTNSNSYVSVAAADTYFERQGNPTSWTSSSREQKEMALRVATAYITERYGNRWRGVIDSDTQALDWPRSGVVDADTGLYYDNDEMPARLLNATAEVALRYRAGTTLRPDVAIGDGNVTSSTVSVGGISITEDFVGSATTAPDFPEVKDKLRSLLTDGGAGLLHRVTR